MTRPNSRSPRRVCATVIALALLGACQGRSTSSDAASWFGPGEVPRVAELAPGATAGLATFLPSVSARQLRFRTPHALVTVSFASRDSALAALPRRARPAALRAFAQAIAAELEAEWVAFGAPLGRASATDAPIPVLVTEASRRGRYHAGEVHASFAGVAAGDLTHELRHAMLGPAPAWIAEGIATSGLRATPLTPLFRALTAWSLTHEDWDRPIASGPPTTGGRRGHIETKLFYARAADFVSVLVERWGTNAVIAFARDAPRHDEPEVVASRIAWRAARTSEAAAESRDRLMVERWVDWSLNRVTPADPTWTGFLPWLQADDAVIVAGRADVLGAHLPALGIAPLATTARSLLVLTSANPSSVRAAASRLQPATAPVAALLTLRGERSSAEERARAMATLQSWQLAARDAEAFAWRKAVVRAAVAARYARERPPARAIAAWSDIRDASDTPTAMRRYAERQIAARDAE